jgi:hypothetical protein
MIWQWIIIGAAVLLAGLYILRLVRANLKAPFCSDCAGCHGNRLTQLLKKERKSHETLSESNPAGE